MFKDLELLAKSPYFWIFFLTMFVAFAILLVFFLREIINRAKIKEPGGHGLGFFCKSTGKVFPITDDNLQIIPCSKNDLDGHRKVSISCVCGRECFLNIKIGSIRTSREIRKALSVPGYDFQHPLNRS